MRYILIKISGTVAYIGLFLLNSLNRINQMVIK